MPRILYIHATNVLSRLLWLERVDLIKGAMQEKDGHSCLNMMLPQLQVVVFSKFKECMLRIPSLLYLYSCCKCLRNSSLVVKDGVNVYCQQGILVYHQWFDYGTPMFLYPSDLDGHLRDLVPHVFCQYSTFCSACFLIHYSNSTQSLFNIIEYLLLLQF